MRGQALKKPRSTAALRGAGFRAWDLGGVDSSTMMAYKRQVSDFCSFFHFFFCDDNRISENFRRIFRQIRFLSEGFKHCNLSTIPIKIIYLGKTSDKKESPRTQLIRTLRTHAVHTHLHYLLKFGKLALIFAEIVPT